MAVTVFVLGRSGSGKSTSARYLASLAQKQGWDAKKFDDHNILYDMFVHDHELEPTHRKFRATEGGGFEVMDFAVYRQVLARLEQQIQQFTPLKPETLITIEFTRNDYREIMQVFSERFFQERDVHFLFLACDLPQCLERIQERVAYPETEDDFFVDDKILFTHYPCPYMPPRIAGKVVKLINNIHEFPALYEQLHAFACDVLNADHKQEEVASVAKKEASAIVLSV